jgi:hypothetical protein
MQLLKVTQKRMHANQEKMDDGQEEMKAQMRYLAPPSPPIFFSQKKMRTRVCAIQYKMWVTVKCNQEEMEARKRPITRSLRPSDVPSTPNGYPPSKGTGPSMYPLLRMDIHQAKAEALQCTLYSEWISTKPRQRPFHVPSTPNGYPPNQGKGPSRRIESQDERTVIKKRLEQRRH